jgi:hypothetical protein
VAIANTPLNASLDWQPLFAPWTDWLTHADVPIQDKIKMITADQPTILSETTDVSDANR